MSFGYFYGSQSESFSFYRIPRELVTGEYFRSLSTDAKLLYGLLLDRMGLSAKNGWLDESGRVYIYYTVEEITKDLNCGHVKAGKLLAELDSNKGIGLIERVKQGQGKPTKIYVKQFTMLVPIPQRDNCALSRPTKNGSPEVQKADGKTYKNDVSRPTESIDADLSKADANYNNKNYTENSYTYPSTNHVLPVIDEMDEQNIRDEVKKQIDFEVLEVNFPYNDAESFLELICEVLCSSAATMRIGNEQLSTDRVKARFRQLEYGHIEYVIDTLKKTTNEIHNIRAYLLTALYNAPVTIGPYYSAAVRHDYG